jgi:hypothetical protein
MHVSRIALIAGIFHRCMNAPVFGGVPGWFSGPWRGARGRAFLQQHRALGLAGEPAYATYFQAPASPRRLARMPNSCATTAADWPLASQFGTASRLKASSNWRRILTGVSCLDRMVHYLPNSPSVNSKHPHTLTRSNTQNDTSVTRNNTFLTRNNTHLTRFNTFLTRTKSAQFRTQISHHQSLTGQPTPKTPLK